MSHSSKPSHGDGNGGSSPLGLDSFTNQLRNSLISLDDVNKPDFRELDLDSPVSPLRARAAAATTTTTTTTSSSSSSSGSAANHKSSHSGELTNPKSAAAHQTRSDPLIYYSGGGGGGSSQSSVTSPVSCNVVPTGNICPSRKILKSGLSSLSNRSSKTDVLGSGTGNYGHGSIMRGGGGGVITGTAKCSSGGSSGSSVHWDGGISDPEELKRIGNEMHKKGLFAEALTMYDKAILLSPSNAAYRSNRAAALIGLGRIGDAVRECQEAVRLDPNYWRAHQRLGALFIR